MFDNLSELWIGIVLLVGVVVASARWIVAKTSGKELTPGDSNILGNLRTKIVSGIASNMYLIELEKNEGRKAVRDEIEILINEYIEATSTLTSDEKDLLISLDKTQLIEYIEKELIRLKVLKGE